MPLSRYYAWLRRQVGNGLLVIPGVAACVFNEKGHVLCARHAGSALWAPPGGAVEPDETPSEALLRELAEELGVQATVEGLIGVYGGPNWRITYPHGDAVSYVTTVYACVLHSTTFTLDTQEITATRYLSPSDATRRPVSAWVPSVLLHAHRWWYAHNGPVD